MKLQLHNVLFRFRTLPSVDKAFRSLHYSVPLFASRTDRRSRWKGFPIHVGVGIKKTIEMQSDTDIQSTLTHKPRLSECNSLPMLQESNVQCAAGQSRLKAVTGQSPKSPGTGAGRMVRVWACLYILKPNLPLVEARIRARDNGNGTFSEPPYRGNKRPAMVALQNPVTQDSRAAWRKCWCYPARKSWY